MTLGPQTFTTPQWTPQKQNIKFKKPKPQKPKTQISNLMLQWNYEHKTSDTRTTKLLPQLSMVTPEAPKTQNPKTQISNLMLQGNYENKTFDNSNTKLLPHLNGDPRSNTQNLKPKNPNLPDLNNPKPKSQIPKSKTLNQKRSEFNP